MLFRFLFFLSCLFLPLTATSEVDIRGNIAAQVRIFSEESLHPQQEETYFSVSAEPEFYWESASQNDSFLFVPFGRWDEHDDERSHADIREASWVHLADQYELRTGLRRVFWGKTEFQHLVDVINQFDSVEDIDNEDKLGQPMVNLSFVRDWGILDLFVLPYFRERSFQSLEGRPRLPLPVDIDNALYESDHEQEHIDYAIRWSHYISVFDFGLSWFKGTGRDPLLIPALDANNQTVLTPFYEQVEQASFDGQATIGSWLWKMELLYRDSKRDSFWASQAGFEYTFYALGKSAADLGVLVEYGWDERGKNSSSPFQNDLFMGGRLALNDVDSSELLFGVGYDLDNQSHSALMEGSRRFGNQFKILVDLRLFESDEPNESFYTLRRDDHIQITAEYYF